MKIIRNIITVFATTLFFSCADNNVTPPDAWPEWPSLPQIESPQLRGLNGETTVSAGDRVRFTATVTDNYNDLASYTLEFKAGETIIASKNGTLSGSSAQIEFETIMPFGAYFSEGGYPEVSLSVVNVVNVTATLTLADKDNVNIVRPETPSHLYIVDNNGAVFTLDRMGESYLFKSTTSLSTLGTSFKIATKVTPNNQIDYSEIVWGLSGSNIVVVNEASATSIDTPNSEGHGIKSISFDMYSFNLTKLVDYTVTFNMATMTVTPKGGINYLYTDATMVQDCEVEFENFDRSPMAIVRPDLFTDFEGNTARFVGPSRVWRAFYNQDKGFFYFQTNNNEADLLWLTGAGGGFPLPPYAATFDWFGTEPHGYFSFLRTGADTFSMLLYLAEGFVLQPYRMVSWGTVLSWNSTTPQFFKVNPNNDGVPGPEFTPGVYQLTVNVATGATSLIPYK